MMPFPFLRSVLGLMTTPSRESRWLIKKVFEACIGGRGFAWTTSLCICQHLQNTINIIFRFELWYIEKNLKQPFSACILDGINFRYGPDTTHNFAKFTSQRASAERMEIVLNFRRTDRAHRGWFQGSVMLILPGRKQVYHNSPCKVLDRRGHISLPYQRQQGPGPVRRCNGGFLRYIGVLLHGQMVRTAHSELPRFFRTPSQYIILKSWRSLNL